MTAPEKSNAERFCDPKQSAARYYSVGATGRRSRCCFPGVRLDWRDNIHSRKTAFAGTQRTKSASTLLAGRQSRSCPADHVTVASSWWLRMPAKKPNASATEYPLRSLAVRWDPATGMPTCSSPCYADRLSGQLDGSNEAELDPTTKIIFLRGERINPNY